MNKYLLVKIKGDYLNLFLRKCLNQKIYFKKIKYLKKNEIYCYLKADDYQLLKKTTRNIEFKKIKYIGLYYYFNKLKKNLYLFICLFLGTVLLFFMSNIMLEINILHHDSELRHLIALELEDHGIKKLSYKKSYREIEIIKKDIKEKYKERIEWIEIVPEGMKYTVRIEERILNSKENGIKRCHVVATKDALIKEIISHKGDRVVEINDYVKKGDILINGDITFNNEIKSSVCADGNIYGEVWYRATIKMSLKKINKEITGKENYNFLINNHRILKSRFKEYDTLKKRKLSFGGVTFYLVKEKEFKSTEVKLTEEETIKEALNKLDESLKKKNDEKEAILSKNVLKKETNDSTIDLEVFIVAKENVGTVLEY